MKKILLLFIAFIVVSTINAQAPQLFLIENTTTNSASLNLKNTVGFWHLSGPRSYEANNPFSIFWNNGTSYQRHFSILDNGNIGIGTNIPSEKLDVIGNIKISEGVIIGQKRDANVPLQVYSSNPSENIKTILGNASGRWEFAVAGTNGAYHPTAKPGTGIIRKLGNHNMVFSMPNNNSVDPNSDVSSYNSPDITTIRFTDAVNHNSLVIYNTGKVTVGTPKYDNEPGYLLYVKDGIKTEKVKVEVANENGWADFVFNENYELTSLEDLEIFIHKNKHLPEIPTTEEVLENGVELGELNAKLLQKIEELTLYTIAQEQQLKEQQQKNKELEARLQTIEKMLNKQ